MDKATQVAPSGRVLPSIKQSASAFSCKKHPIASCNTKKPELRYSVEELMGCSSNLNEPSAMLSSGSCFMCSEEAQNSLSLLVLYKDRLLT